MYEIFIERNAEKELDKLESGTFDTITESISNLAEEPRPVGCCLFRTKYTGCSAESIQLKPTNIFYKTKNFFLSLAAFFYLLQLYFF